MRIPATRIAASRSGSGKRQHYLKDGLLTKLSGGKLVEEQLQKNITLLELLFKFVIFSEALTISGCNVRTTKAADNALKRGQPVNYPISSSAPSSILIDLSECWKDLLSIQQTYGHQQVSRFFVDYWPPRGAPSSPINLYPPFLPIHTQIAVNETWPAVGYNVNLMVEFNSGAQRKIYQKIVYSSPEPPRLLSAESGVTTFSLSYEQPNSGISQQYYAYYLEYFRIDEAPTLNAESEKSSQLFFVNTNATSLRLRNLLPSTAYAVRVFSRFLDVQSLQPLRILFRTKVLQKSEPSVVPDDYHTLSVSLPHYTQISSATPTHCTLHPMQQSHHHQLLDETLLGRFLSQEQPPSTTTVDNSVSASLVTANPAFFSPEINGGLASMSDSKSPSSTVKKTLSGVVDPLVNFETKVIKSGVQKLTTMKSSTKDNVSTARNLAVVDDTRSGLSNYVNHMSAAPHNSANAPGPDLLEEEEVDVNDVAEEVQKSSEYDGEPDDRGSVEVIGETEESVHSKDAKKSSEQSEDEEGTDFLDNENFTEDVENEEEKMKRKIKLKSPKVGKKEKAKNEEVNHGVANGNQGDDGDAELDDVNNSGSPIRVCGYSTFIRASLTDGGQLRIDWTVPETALCDEYRITYWVVSTNNRGSLKNGSTKEATVKPVTISTTDTFVQLSGSNTSTVDIKVECMFEGAFSSSDWSAHRVISLEKPRSIRNLKVRQVDTDENYVASVALTFLWPPFHDFNFYDVVVSWSLGKKIVGKNQMTINRRVKVVKVNELEPAQLYTFTVKNVSREFHLSSSSTGLRQLTPPVITSSLYAGRVASNAINVKFDQSSGEYAFDSYELVFCRDDGLKNITNQLEKNDRKSFNFNRLTPGRTYRFVLYTVFKGLRSRPVVTLITTYPSKVKKFRPIIGPGYATLEWELDNVANNYCDFRLSYSSKSNLGVEKSQDVSLNGSVRSHRFTSLDYDTYYTFTIIVVMGEGNAAAASEAQSVTVGFAGRARFFPLLKRFGSRELSLTFENDRNSFPDLNGALDNFAIIVTEDVKAGGDTYVLKSWYDVSEETVRSAYRASASTYQPFRQRDAAKFANFIIGDEECDESRKMTEPYCNGALRAHVDYFVKIRAYTVANIALETDWISVRGVVIGGDGRRSVNDVNQDLGYEVAGKRRLPCHMYLNGCRNDAIALEFRTKLLGVTIAFLAANLLRWN